MLTTAYVILAAVVLWKVVTAIAGMVADSLMGAGSTGRMKRSNLTWTERKRRGLV